jgi:predicted ATPase/class 3 adenylate cyclase
MTDLPTGTVTFLFTDIEGSTRLLQRLGGSAYAEVRDQHHRLLRAAFASYDGVEVDTQGDAFFVAFATARDAVATAAAATRALAHAAWPEGTSLQVRMGLHTGTPLVAGDHYVGLDVVRAARIAAAGHGGQVLMSDATRVLVVGALPDGVLLRELGAYQLKDLQQPEPLWQLVLPGLPADFPALKTLDRHPHNLPIQPTPLLGREREVERVCALLRRDDVRLVTLTGPGGTGKTRLGLQVAAELVDECADGVWFVRLSRVSDPELVLPTIAQTLGLREAGSVPISALLREYVRTRHLLLLLDNCEQVVAAAPQMADLLARSPGLTLLVTSRVPLHLQGEHEYRVPPLALPKPPTARAPHTAQVVGSPAVALFVARAQAHWPAFHLTEATTSALAEICARLDGLPLAIELAAARVKLLPPGQLLQRLEHRLPLLVGGARDQEDRQQTMQQTIAWSYDLLTPAAQRLFQRLAVFVGGFTLQAAEAICAAPEGAEPLETSVLDGLGALIDHSLVWLGDEGEEGGAARFGMLHVIREYALERLEACGEAETLRRAHAAYYVALAAPDWAADHAATDEDGAVALALVERRAVELENLRATLAWLRTRAEAVRLMGGARRSQAERASAQPGDEASALQGLRLAGALVWVWAYRGHLSEGRAWLEAFLALDRTREVPPLAAPLRDAAQERGSATSVHRRRTLTARAALQAYVRALALYATGVLAYWQGDSAAAVPLLEQSLAITQALGDRPATGWVLTGYVLNNLGMAVKDQGDLARARACYEEALALGLGRARNDQYVIANTLSNLSSLALAAGDLEQADARSAESLVVSRQVNYQAEVARNLDRQALIAWRRGQLRPAAALAREALALAVSRAAGDMRFHGDSLEVYAIIGASQEHAERAARLLGAVVAFRERIGMRRPMDVLTAADIEAVVTPARAALGEAMWAVAFAAGRALTLEEAIAEALDAVE